MFDTAYTWVLTFEFTNLVGLLLFWVPLLVCAVGYLFMCFDDFHKDSTNRAAADAASQSRAEDPKGYGNGTSTHYQPTLYIGTILGRIILTLLPAVNLGAMIFSVGPYLSGNFFKYLNQVFNVPLVPKRPK